ncbi:hypothetical protein IMG5_029460 [Ichthyophthirius multifiliis]|uniref:Uncharacterized protein n=1 Tax=Ichthyophthirius multifiliis TaxID=5932 RepID=G0QLE6_ICHMU|nr:hypothetical protein IMG5_029460 [Ichthyophthirius multifiliis]EGR33962.1 hypothetical protein IMG5_029460 [Ichthyophthirius multifiliis]|eukprot:XP_004039266.1 hypothetical protein IMG5_029460 [Ichthyophthirius multifiliis]
MSLKCQWKVQIEDNLKYNRKITNKINQRKEIKFQELIKYDYIYIYNFYICNIFIYFQFINLEIKYLLIFIIKQKKKLLQQLEQIKLWLSEVRYKNIQNIIIQQDSPQNDRIARIAEKLSNVYISQDTNNNLKIDQSEEKLQKLEDSIKEFETKLQNKVNIVKTTVNKLQKFVNEDKVSRLNYFQQKEQELQILEQNLNKQLDNEIQVFKILYIYLYINIYIYKQINFLQLYNIITQYNIQLINVYKNYILYFSLYIIKQRKNDEIKKQREQIDEQIIKRTFDEILKVNQLLETEKQDKEESEQAIFDMLKEVVNRVKNEIDIERKNRENTEEKLLELLEVTCSKLNVATQI